jgi:phosphoribosylformimino-5-aminoimidazole carboxamide ribotide isomerase
MFRPCIDLHQGKVKQIVGGTFNDAGSGLRENFVADRPASYYANLYRQDRLTGGHVILLGPGNTEPAQAALAAYPNGLQVGGGIQPDNARAWLDAGASHVIVTSWLFREGDLDSDRLRAMEKAAGSGRLVLDLSCRRQGDDYYVVSDRWQRFTRLRLGPEVLGTLAEHCAEFLIHGVDVEGKRLGIDRDLVERLGIWAPIATTYAGGANSLQDLEDVTRIGQGRIDLTIGSALDIFGGSGVRYADAVAFNRRTAQP